MSRGDEDGHGSILNYSLHDLEQHAVELARLATTFDKQENWEAASYYYQVRKISFFARHIFFGALRFIFQL